MDKAKLIRVGVLGAGFWARYQIAGWRQLPGVEVAALFNRTRSKAEALAGQFDIPEVYDDAEEMIRKAKPDVLDVITDMDTHSKFVLMAAEHRLPVICQKPMAPNFETAKKMVAACRDADVPFYVHENWRWQTPIRELARALRQGHIGKPFRARITMVSGFPVFKNQPFFKDLEQFILTDIGSHVLDVARFLFGEADRLYCQTHRVHGDIKGEDVATVQLHMRAGVTVLVEMGYAENYLEVDRFPETFILVEGEKGSIQLAPDYWVRVTTADGTHAKRHPPPRFAWADPEYDVVQSSVVPCNADLLKGLRGEGEPETTGEDNLKTVELVFKSYESAAAGQAVTIRG